MSSSSSTPSNKRQRVEGVIGVVSTSVRDGEKDNEEEDDEASLLQLLNGDDFVSSEQRQEDAAAQRRAARRNKRLQQSSQSSSSQQDQGGLATKTNDGSSNDKMVDPPTVSKKYSTANNGNKKRAPPAESSTITKVVVPIKSSSNNKSDMMMLVDSGVVVDDNEKHMVKKKDNDDDDDDDDDDFDMFSSSVSPPPPPAAAADASRVATDSDVHAPTTTAATAAKQQQHQQQQHRRRGHEQQDWDDAEGYYKAVIGETIELKIQNNTNASAAAASAAATTTTTSDSATTTSSSSSSPQVILLRVLGVVGKGVFSTVLKCTTLSNASSIALPPTVALKCIRHNETMTKAAQAEIRILQQLESSPGIVPLLLPQNQSNSNNGNHANTTTSYLEHCGHLLLVFPFLEYNLRDVLQKFGKGVGLSLQAVRSYAGQLLAAATHLKKHNLIHADLKPDNILVSGDFSTVQLADFGSVIESSSSSASSTTTPYLVSRFYRAPEIILGLSPLTVAVDLWSLAVTVAEVFLGRVLFRGQSNNDMLYVFMQHLGPISNRVIRQHLVSCQKHGHAVVQRHFQQEATNYVFLQQTHDAVTGEAVHKVLPLQQSTSTASNKNNKFPLATPLRQKILQAKSAKDSRLLVTQFADLLQKALALDPTRRISLKDALQHEFFQQQDS